MTSEGEGIHCEEIELDSYFLHCIKKLILDKLNNKPYLVNNQKKIWENMFVPSKSFLKQDPLKK